jgi:hypothetical protein
MTQKRLVIVGNGMATSRLLDEILRRTFNEFDSTVVGGKVIGWGINGRSTDHSVPLIISTRFSGLFYITTF